MREALAMPSSLQEQQAPPRGSDNSGWKPVPDPTELTTAAVERATEVFRREILSLRETLETRLNGSDQDRARMWDRLGELPKLYEVAAGHLRDEVMAIASHNREVLTQRLNDLDTATRVASERIERIPAENISDAKALASDIRESMRSEREFILSQIELAKSATDKVSEVMLEKFEAVASTFASNALALTAALAAQKEAAAEANKSAALAIAKSEAATQETIKSNSAQTQTGQQALSDILTDVKDRVVRLESLDVGVRQASTEIRAAHTEQRLSQGAIVSLVIMSVGVIGLIVTLITVFHK